MSGYDLMSQGLNQLAQAWEKSNQYSTIDLAGTIAKFFKKKDEPPANVSPIENSSAPNVTPLNYNPANYPPSPPEVPYTPPSNVTPLNFNSADYKTTMKPEPIQPPATEATPPQTNASASGQTTGNAGASPYQGAFDISMLASDNPYRGYIPTNTGIIQRKVRPETIAAALQWEEENKRKSLADQLSQFEYDAKRGNYITLDQETLDKIPEPQRSYYKVGQLVPRQDLLGMIPKEPTTTGYTAETARNLAQGLYPANQFRNVLANLPDDTDPAVIEDLVNRANAAQMSLDDLYEQNSSSEKKEPTFVEKMNTAYQNFIKSHPVRRDSFGKLLYQPPSQIDWIRTTYGEQQARQYASESSNDPTLMNRPTTASKRGTAKYKPSNKYSEEDWWTIDEKIKNAGSFAKIAKQLLSSKNVSPSYREVLAARSGLTLAQLEQKYGTIARTGTLNGKKVIYYADGTAITQ